MLNLKNYKLIKNINLLDNLLINNFIKSLYNNNINNEQIIINLINDNINLFLINNKEDNNNKENNNKINENKKNKEEINKNEVYDKYYTKVETVNKIGEIIKDKLEITKEDIIIEPSAGNGRFINLIKTLTTNYKFYDILPENEEIIKQDFLLLDNEILKNTIILGNPPYGKNNKLVIKFIKKCCENKCKYICFILPKSFKKENMQKYFTLNYHLIYEMDIKEKFDYEDKEIKVPSIFMIWEYKEELREIKNKYNTNDFTFIKNSSDDYNYLIRRVGSKAGILISKEKFKYSLSSFYKLKINDNNVINKLNNLYDKLNKKANDSTGPKSLSQNDIIEIYCLN